jgi:DNA-binding NarL/FixJ family response regulator
MPAVRVLIVDDHPLVRANLRLLLEDSGLVDVVGEAADGDEVVAAARASAPQVVLMDFRMPRVDGLAGARSLRQEGFAGRVVLLTSYLDLELLQAADEAGIERCLHKDVAVGELLAALTG